MSDINGDGWEDVAVASMSPLVWAVPFGIVEFPAAKVFILSGSDGEVLSEMSILREQEGGLEPLKQFSFGIPMCNIGDADGDGVDDLAVAALDFTIVNVLPLFLRKFVAGSTAFIVSGRDHREIGRHSLRGSRAAWIEGADRANNNCFVLRPMGASRTVCEKLGLPQMDIIDESSVAGSPLAVSSVRVHGHVAIVVLVGSENVADRSVFAISSQRLSELYSISIPGASDVLGVEDYDGDGVGEILVVIALGKSPEIQLRSGRNGKLLRRSSDESLLLRSGGIAIVPDADGDGISDIACECHNGIALWLSGSSDMHIIDVSSGAKGATIFPGARRVVGIRGPEGSGMVIVGDPLGGGDERAKGEVQAISYGF